MQYRTRKIDNNLSVLKTGLNNAADIITSTMGGSGKNVIISNSNNEIKFTKDGVSVAKDITMIDPIENIGSSMLIEAANKTVEQCGDGTTSTVLFIQTLINSKNILEDKNEFLDELDSFLEKFEIELKAQTRVVDNIDDIYKIAITSCKSPKVANLIKEIYSKVGFTANVSLEMSRIADSTYYELVEGLNFESGFVNSGFANQDNGSCVLEDSYIVIEKNPVSSTSAYIDIFDECLSQDKAIAIISPQFSETFIKFCLGAKSMKGLKICLIKMPGYGSYQKENIRDINAFITEGMVDKLVANSYEFVLFNRPNVTSIKKRVEQLTRLADSAMEDYDEQDYLQRISKLQQTGAIIYVGGITDKNKKEEYDRIEDAIGAVSTAIKQGYVRGAGVELIRLIPLFKDSKIYPLIEELLSAPFYKILQNANINRTVKSDIPFNVKTKTYDDNIIDPTGVILNSLKNATALFKLLINTSYIIYNE